MMVSRDTPAVVLKFDPNVMHHGGLGVIRSLGRIGVPVYGMHEGPWAPAASSRYLRGRCFWRPSPDDTEQARTGLLRLADRIGRPAVLVPTDDAGAIFLAEHGDGLRGSFLFPDPPPDLPRRADKFSLYQLCRELGVPSVRTALAGSPEAAIQFAATAGFPLVAKLTTPWAKGRGRPRSTSIVHSPEQLGDVCQAAAAAGVTLMLQEYIPGGPGQDWFFHGYCDAESRCRPAFTGVKDRSYPAHAGLTSGADELETVLRGVCRGEAWFPPEMLGEILRELRDDVRRAREDSDPLDVLSPRERDVLASMAEGRRGRQIAEDLMISTDTVRTHIRSIFSKLDVHSRLEAVRAARAVGLGPRGHPGTNGGVAVPVPLHPTRRGRR